MTCVLVQFNMFWDQRFFSPLLHFILIDLRKRYTRISFNGMFLSIPELNIIHMVFGKSFWIHASLFLWSIPHQVPPINGRPQLYPSTSAWNKLNIQEEILSMWLCQTCSQTRAPSVNSGTRWRRKKSVYAFSISWCSNINHKISFLVKLVEPKMNSRLCSIRQDVLLNGC